MSEAHAHENHAAPRTGGTPLVLTGLAAERFRKVMEQEKLGAGYGVRIAVLSGGCSGMSYSMSFENQARKDDTIVEQGGLKLYVDAEGGPDLRVRGIVRSLRPRSGSRAL